MRLSVRFAVGSASACYIPSSIWHLVSMFLHQQGPGVDYCGKPLPVRSVDGRWHPFGEIERTRHRIGDLQARGARAQEEIAKLKTAYRELDDRSRLILKLILILSGLDFITAL